MKYKTTLVALATLLFVPGSAWAFQSHPAPEGLYTHQIAHVFFIFAMAMLVYWLERNRFTQGRGWRLIQIACVLLIVWNIAAFAGHWVEEQIPPSAVVGEPDWTQRIDFSSHWLAPVYYMLKLDHLISVPAMICLFLGIKSLYRQALSEKRDQ